MTNQVINITLPQKWDQLSEQQLEFVSKLLLREVPEVELITRCFFHFSGIKILSKDPVMLDGELCYEFKKSGSGRFPLDIDLTTSIIQRMEWITHEITLFANPARIKRYTGCHFKLYGVTLEEWLIVDQMYIGFAKTKDVKFLDNMLAILYTKPGEKWDTAVSLSDRAKRFKRVPLFRKYLIFLWYTSVKLWLRTKYTYLFSDAGGKTVQSANDYVMGLLSSLNEGDVTHNPQIKATECHEVFYELNRKIEKSQNF
jgi:hypothetical protein